MCGGFLAAEFQSEKSLIQWHKLYYFRIQDPFIYYYTYITHYYSWFKEDAQPLHLDILEDAVMKKISWSEWMIWTFKLNKMLRNWCRDDYINYIIIIIILFCIMLLWRRWSLCSLQCSADSCGSVKQIRWEINPVIIFTVHFPCISTTERRRVMTDKITHSRKE